jgi:hypothetical protein
MSLKTWFLCLFHGHDWESVEPTKAQIQEYDRLHYRKEYEGQITQFDRDCGGYADGVGPLDADRDRVCLRCQAKELRFTEGLISFQQWAQDAPARAAAREAEERQKKAAEQEKARLQEERKNQARKLFGRAG